MQSEQRMLSSLSLLLITATYGDFYMCVNVCAVLCSAVRCRGVEPAGKRDWMHGWCHNSQQSYRTQHFSTPWFIESMLLPLAKNSTCEPMASQLCSIPTMWPAMCFLSLCTRGPTQRERKEMRGWTKLKIQVASDFALCLKCHLVIN